MIWWKSRFVEALDAQDCGKESLVGTAARALGDLPGDIARAGKAHKV
jgi:hypothetical protein